MHLIWDAGCWIIGTIGLSSGLASVSECTPAERVRGIGFNDPHYVLLNGSLATCSALGNQPYAGSTEGRWNISVYHAPASGSGTVAQITGLSVRGRPRAAFRRAADAEAL
jgi:hypothetical protein